MLVKADHVQGALKIWFMPMFGLVFNLAFLDAHQSMSSTVDLLYYCVGVVCCFVDGVSNPAANSLVHPISFCGHNYALMKLDPLSKLWLL